MKRLSDLSDQSPAVAAAVDFEIFRPELDRPLAYCDGLQGGRPPSDPATMFIKILLIQAANNLSDLAFFAVSPTSSTTILGRNTIPIEAS